MKRWIALAVAGGLVAAIGLSRSYSDNDKGAGGWVAPETEAKKTNPVPADDASLAAGKAAFAKNCVMCHGEQGKGDGPAAGMFKPAPRDLRDPSISSQTDGALFWKITEGKTPMPAYRGILSDKDRWSVVNYVRKLAPPPASQPAKK